MEDIGTGCEIKDNNVYDQITDKKIPKYRIFTYNVGNKKFCFDILTLYKSYLVRNSFFNPYTNEELPENILPGLQDMILKYLFSVKLNIKYFPEGIVVKTGVFDKNKYKNKKIWQILKKVAKENNIAIDDFAVSDIYFNINNELNQIFNFYEHYNKDFNNNINHVNFMNFIIETSKYPFTQKINLWESLTNETLLEATEYNENFITYYDEFRFNLLTNNNPEVITYITGFPLKGTALITHNNYNIFDFAVKNNLLYIFEHLLSGIYNILGDMELESFMITLIKYIAIMNNVSVLTSFYGTFKREIINSLKFNNWELLKDILSSEIVLDSTKTYFLYMFSKKQNLIKGILLDIAYDAIYTGNSELLKMTLSNGFLRDKIILIIKRVIQENPEMLSELKDFRVYILEQNELIEYAKQRNVNLEEEL